MPSIGETLREARMRQRLDIADVEASTKIRAKYLRALENEEFGLLPGSTFVKTFLRTYAEVLGLDPHLLVEEYRAHYEGPDEAELQPLTPPAVSRRQREPRARGPGGPNRLAIAVGGVLALLVFLVILGWDRDGEEEPTPATTQQAADRTETTAEDRPREPKPKRRKRRAAAPRSVSLRIAPTGPTYVCLDRGEGAQPLFEGTISAPQTFKGRRLRLNLGRTAVQITLNGKRFNVPQVSEPVGYEFTPRGGKPLPSGQRPCA